MPMLLKTTSDILKHKRQSDTNLLFASFRVRGRPINGRNELPKYDLNVSFALGSDKDIWISLLNCRNLFKIKPYVRMFRL